MSKKTVIRMWRCVCLGILLSALFAAPLLAGERAILRVHTWSDYFDLDVLADFEERHNCVVALDTFDSNEEMLEELLSGAGEGYDIITPSSYMAVEMRRRGLLQDIDHSLVPNLANLDADFAALGDDPAMAYSVPYTRTVTGVGFRLSGVGEAARSWAIFSNAAFAGRLTMLNDMRESMGAALKYLGYSLNTVDSGELAEAGEQLLKWRKNLAKFEVDEGNVGLASGEYLAVQGYNGDLAVVMEENRDIGFFVPEEGAAVSIDEFVILAQSAHRELAHAFVNHMLDNETAARNMASILYYMPVPEAVKMLPPEILDNPAFTVPEATMAKCELIRDLGEAAVKYESVWRQVVGD